MRGLSLAALALCGCATVVPMQTASTVDPMQLRVGGQLSLAAWCGRWSGAGGALQCSEYPEGVPLPELRLGGRLGLARGVDVGASLQLSAQLFGPERPMQGGLSADVKLELLRVPTSGPTHLLSAGLLAGGALAGRFGLRTWAELEWAVPVFYGLQLAQWEVVLGASVSRRHTVSPGPAGAFDTHRVGLTVGLFKRAPAGFAVQLGYLAQPERFDSGAVQLQVGLFFDLLLKRG